MATFANARYEVPQADWEQFRDELHVTALIEPLEALGVMDLVSGEYALTDEITAIPTPGHTPGHQSFVIASAGERALILGDVMHHPAQTEETAWSPSFDSDGALSAETRSALLERLEADGDLVRRLPLPGAGLRPHRARRGQAHLPRAVASPRRAPAGQASSDSSTRPTSRGSPSGM